MFEEYPPSDPPTIILTTVEARHPFGLVPLSPFSAGDFALLSAMDMLAALSAELLLLATSDDCQSDILLELHFVEGSVKGFHYFWYRPFAAPSKGRSFVVLSFNGGWIPSWSFAPSPCLKRLLSTSFITWTTICSISACSGGGTCLGHCDSLVAILGRDHGHATRTEVLLLNFVLCFLPPWFATCLIRTRLTPSGSSQLKWYSKPAKEWAMLVEANEIPGHILLPAPNGSVAIAQALMMTLVLGGIMYSPIFASSVLSLGSMSGNGGWSRRLMVQLQQLGFHPTNVKNPLLGREQIAHIKTPGKGEHFFQKGNELFLIITTHSAKRDLSNNRAREPTHLFRQVDGKPCSFRQPYRRYEVGKLFLSERTEGFDHLPA
nr:hypothetical protein Iba_chr13dCG4170 [Ipomoea batatas]